MMYMIQTIKWKSVLVALFAFYIAPLLPLMFLSSLFNINAQDGPVPIYRASFMYMGAWFIAIAPVCSGYFAAKLAKQQPLFHGLAACIGGSILFSFITHSDSWVFVAVTLGIVLSSGIFGGWVYRYRSNAAPKL